MVQGVNAMNELTELERRVEAIEDELDRLEVLILRLLDGLPPRQLVLRVA